MAAIPFSTWKRANAVQAVVTAGTNTQPTPHQARLIATCRRGLAGLPRFGKDPSKSSKVNAAHHCARAGKAGLHLRLSKQGLENLYDSVSSCVLGGQENPTIRTGKS